MPYLAPVEASDQIGPIYAPLPKKKRDIYSQQSNECCAQIDQVFKDTTAGKQIDFLHTNPLEVLKAPKPEEIIDDYQEMIKDHVERRIQFFFQQLIICYQTKLHFKTVGASDQAKSAEAITLRVKSKNPVHIKRNAAHSSTAPRLIAYEKEGAATGFVFLKGTDYYRTQQATMNMPRWINDADREIDEKTQHSLLREKAEHLLNRASQGAITPDEGIKLFAKEALVEIDKGIRRATSVVAKVLELYQAHFLHFQENVQNDPDFLQKFLNCKFKSAQDEKSKRVILNMRYKAIRDVQVDQAALIQKVEAVRLEVLPKGRKPDFFKEAFRTLLIESAGTPGDRQRLEKLYNFSPESFLAQYPNAQVTKFNKTKEGLKAHADKIEFVAKEILSDMRHLRTKEQYLRAEITKELRVLKGWTQTQLGDNIKKLFEQAASSQSTICRIERGKKRVTPQIAEELSQVFDVDAGLFMPHFFYD